MNSWNINWCWPSSIISCIAYRYSGLRLGSVLTNSRIPRHSTFSNSTPVFIFETTENNPSRPRSAAGSRWYQAVCVNGSVSGSSQRGSPLSTGCSSHGTSRYASKCLRTDCSESRPTNALLEAQAEYTADLYAALVRHELERTDVTIQDRLEQITRVLSQALENDLAISRLMATRTSLFFGSSGAKADKDRASQQLLADLFSQGQAAGQIDPRCDPLQLAELYTATVILTATNWLNSWWGESDQPLAERLLDALTILLEGAGTGH